MVIDANEVVGHYLDWATAHSGAETVADLELRGGALCRLVGKTTMLPRRQRDGSRRTPFRSLGLDVNRHLRPPPTALRRRIEELVEMYHRAGQRIVSNGRIFILPSWLALGAATVKRVPTTALRIQFTGPPGAFVVDNDDWTIQQLKAVLLSPRTSRSTRRLHIVESAASTLLDLSLVLGSPPSGFDWLREMITNTEAAERRAIGLWSEFLDFAEVPRALRIPDFELSVRELTIVAAGSANGRDRRWFADKWPAAVSGLFRSGKAKKAFRRVERNRSAAVREATRAFCCAGNADCEKAAVLARAIARHHDDQNLCRVLCGNRREVGERRIRSLLVDQNHDDAGETLRRMAYRSIHSREQMELAVAVATQPVFETVTCRFEVGKLVTRILAGSGVDPSAIEATVIAGGLVAVSADCLAAFVAEESSDEDEDEPAGRLEGGVLRLVGFLSKPEWSLSPTQFVRFVTQAERRVIHQVEVIEQRIHHEWPAPLGWREEDGSDSPTGAIVTPLVDADMTRAEGKDMQHCLQGGGFDRAALLGRLALFSIRFGYARATLALRASEKHRSDGHTEVTRYEIEDLKAKRNASPHPACEEAARSLVERLNSRLPLILSAGEAGRRKAMLEKIANSRTFNPDQEAANHRWATLYRPCLPRRFRFTSASDIVGMIGFR